MFCVGGVGGCEMECAVVRNAAADALGGRRNRPQLSTLYRTRTKFERTRAEFEQMLVGAPLAIIAPLSLATSGHIRGVRVHLRPFIHERSVHLLYLHLIRIEGPSMVEASSQARWALAWLP